MTRKPPGKHPASPAIARVKESASRNELVAVIGTGVSIALTNNKIPALSWKGLILNGFRYGIEKGKITSAQATAWKPQLDSTDLDELLGAAEFMGRKLDAPHGVLYSRWLENIFKPVEPANQNMANAVRALNAAGIPLCTLNYDSLLERVTGLPTVNLSETTKVGAWMRRESAGILHLHGSWESPATCILGIRDYETTLGNDARDLFQRNLGVFRRLLFIGCSDTFADPNFSALIHWLREKMKTAAPEHYALVSESDLAKRHADPSWQGFVEPLSYGPSHGDLPAFLLKHFRTPTSAAATKQSTPSKVPASIPAHAKLLPTYRTFLLKDCGQMTIEGMPGGMDTGRQRFDLERLFVPLQVLPSPPEIPASDPEREQKLLAWKEKNKEPLSFGEVFTTHQRLALLALPGGGKTLLLKRLAVAYADPGRRPASSDALPDLDVTPVLIRCREWREHIHRPILTLLKNIPDIAGQPELAGLSDALIPLFKKGRILLLVDGLDEIHDDGLRATFVGNLERFLDEYKRTRLIVTSREAGFGLVAPSLTRFCTRWRVAPLNSDAINVLCEHWHRLMTADSPQGTLEARQVAEQLQQNASLRRLAENPLLLTMLLVVKHGAGRLPPDRVSLYSRAVEVLLDTWNVQGHPRLNPKEAVPQLAYVAFQLMRAGRQTATEKELLTLLEQAREKVPHIQRYATDTPQQFLKRVELRSSLLVEAGRQAEGTGTVPFYQFRHLTFQEYLAAVAAVEGHYIEYDQGDNVLKPLQDYLTAEEWKEVIPMSAVLARKQAEPLIHALVEQGKGLRRKVESNKDFEGREEWLWVPSKLPGPVARLVQCLVEEAEAFAAAPETLTGSLQVIAYFARGCQSEHDWPALSRGRYGADLLHQAWLLYAPMQWPAETLVRITCISLAEHRQPGTYWESSQGQAELKRLLSSQSPEDIGLALLTCSGLPDSLVSLLLDDVERHIFHESPAVQDAAMCALGLMHYKSKSGSALTPSVLDRLLAEWLGTTNAELRSSAVVALSTQLGLPRTAWMPVLTEAQVEELRQTKKEWDFFHLPAACTVAFHSRTVWPEEELAKRLVELTRRPPIISTDRIAAMLQQMGETGQRYLDILRQNEKEFTESANTAQPISR